MIYLLKEGTKVRNGINLSWIRGPRIIFYFDLLGKYRRQIYFRIRLRSFHIFFNVSEQLK